MSRSLAGHRQLRLGLGPFARVVPGLLAAIAWFTVAVAAGLTGALPGGRWMVVHVFTLGVLTNLLLAFTKQFAGMLTRTRDGLGAWSLLALNGGIIGVLAGMVVANVPLLAMGSGAVLAVVGAARLRLGQMRRSAASTRFAWLLRAYERAHEAFLAAGVLGAVLGAGLIPGAWYAPVRLAHLHLNLLGWAGLVVLGTMVFFVPAMLRIQIPEGVEDRAARALRIGAWALLAGGVLLAASGMPPPTGTVLRYAAAIGLAGYAWAVLDVAYSVLVMGRVAHPGAPRPLVIGSAVWFSVVIIADVVLIAAGAGDRLAPLGVAFGVGVLLQLIIAVGLHLLPSLRGRDFAARDALIARSERGGLARAAALNGATLVLTANLAVPAALPSAAVVVAWSLVVAVVCQALLLAALPVRADPTVARSSVARRHRTDRDRP